MSSSHHPSGSREPRVDTGMVEDMPAWEQSQRFWLPRHIRRRWRFVVCKSKRRVSAHTPFESDGRCVPQMQMAHDAWLSVTRMPWTPVGSALVCPDDEVGGFALATRGTGIGLRDFQKRKKRCGRVGGVAVGTVTRLMPSSGAAAAGSSSFNPRKTRRGSFSMSALNFHSW